MIPLITDWPQAWSMAGMGVGAVFVILILIVCVLQIFSVMARKTTAKAINVKTDYKEKKQAKAFNKASDADKAAVAVALYLYYYEKNNRENRVLTIKHNPNSAWHAELNERL
ncbi:MAG: OadG family protein [Bacteroidaceae bacterium]|nr:OadG family protein [Bacteroidaceae bacterium]